jgi:hypothetical protein
MVIGNVSKINIGLTSALSKPKTKAAIMAEPKLATKMPGNRYATASKATAFKIQTTINIMTSFLN